MLSQIRLCNQGCGLKKKKKKKKKRKWSRTASGSFKLGEKPAIKKKKPASKKPAAKKAKKPAAKKPAAKKPAAIKNGHKSHKRFG